jgi:glycine oxidase
MLHGMAIARVDVVVVGGGIVGLSAARELAAGGASVLVVERGRVGDEASGAAAGMLTAQVHAGPGGPLLELALRARERHAALAGELLAETGIGVERSERGALEIAFTAAAADALARRTRWQRERGLAAESLTAAELAEAEPNLNPAAKGGVFYRDDRAVDNVRLCRALAASAVSRGATLLVGRPVSRLILEGGRVAGVQAGLERIDAPVVVNAAGAWAGLLAGDPAPPPVEPVRGHIVAFEVAPPALRHVVWSPGGYLVPRADGRLLAGSTAENAGFDKTVTAGALAAVLAIALEIVPRLEGVAVAGSWAGLRPGSPDGLPIVGAGAVPGLIHAAGLFKNGILLGPLMGEAAARLALGQDPGLDLSPYSPSRF